MAQQKQNKKTKGKADSTQDGDKMLKAVVLLSLGSFLFFFYVSLSGFQSLLDTGESSQPVVTHVLGASTVVEKEYVEVKLNNANNGEAVLELHPSSPLAIAGAEFHFQLNESLEIEGVVCSSQFVCVDEVEDGVYHLSIFRLPDQADIPLSGKVKVATLLYGENSYGEMILNGGNTRPSMIAELGNDDNLLSSEVLYLAVGRRVF